MPTLSQTNRMPYCVTLLLALSCLVLLGCQNAQSKADSTSTGYATPLKLLPPSERTVTVTGLEHDDVDLSLWPAPARIAGLDFYGEWQGPQQRIMSYRSEDNEQQLTVTLFPLPAGWERMPASRAVAGQYGQIRQQRVQRALQQQHSQVVIDNEQPLLLFDYHAVAAQLRWLHQDALQHREMITLLLRDGLFIRVVNNSPDMSVDALETANRDALTVWLTLMSTAAATE